MAARMQDEVRDFLKLALLTPITSLKKFYSGRIEPSKISLNEMPVLLVYENDEDLVSDQLTTGRDKYKVKLTIQVIINAFAYVSGGGIETDKILLGQRAVQDIISARDSNNKPTATSILGVLRANVLGTKYLFSNDIKIHFENKNEDGKQYYIGTLTVSAVTAYNTR